MAGSTSSDQAIGPIVPSPVTTIRSSRSFIKLSTLLRSRFHEPRFERDMEQSCAVDPADIPSKQPTDVVPTRPSSRHLLPPKGETHRLVFAQVSIRAPRGSRRWPWLRLGPEIQQTCSQECRRSGWRTFAVHVGRCRPTRVC